MKTVALYSLCLLALGGIAGATADDIIDITTVQELRFRCVYGLAWYSSNRSNFPQEWGSRGWQLAEGDFKVT